VSYQITDIAEIIHGSLIHHAGQIQSGVIEHLLIDSRKIIYPETSLFFAIRGERHDGHRYLNEVYEAGVRNFVVEENHDYTFPSDVSVILVKNSLEALQLFTSLHRHSFSLPVIGITGSNGKTIVKEWLYQLLQADVSIIRSPKSYNSQIGVPLSVWNISAEHQLAFFEAGISQKGEMSKLQQIIDPRIGIFTNLGAAHDEGFSSRKEKLHEKLQLFKNAELLIYATDDKMVEEGVSQFLPRHPQLKTLSWSRKGNHADLQFETEIKENHSAIRIRKGSQILGIQIPFTDDASIENACACFAFLMGINRVNTDTLQRFSELTPVEMRLQLKEGINNCVLINDSYSADINALQIALDFLQQQSLGYTPTVILSDFYQSGLSDHDLYTGVARMLQQKGIQKMIAIGEVIKAWLPLFPAHTSWYPNTEEFVRAFKSSDFNQQIILLKGARSFGFEKITSLLTKKVHETVFEINLNALVHNLNFFKSKLQPGVKLMGMVKAFSYGAGSYEIAKVLEFHRADYLTVAYADEGVTLRKAGIKSPIMVMNPEFSALDSIIAYNLEPEVYSLHLLHELIKNANGEELSIHLEVDTGMKRLGFDEEEIDEVISILKQHKNIRVKSVFAHLAASEDKKHDEFTRSQIASFKRISDQVVSAFNYPVLRHILNSGGILRFPEAQFDMVRLGIGLYGIDPSEKFQKELQQIGTLKTVISQIRKVHSHETVGYGRRGTVSKDTLIAVAAIGYADGLNRRLGNGKGYMLINGHKAPIIGSICMDMTMLDISGIPCKEGDEVIVFGNQPNVTDIADKTGTIPYEVLTSISQRVRRIYYYE